MGRRHGGGVAAERGGVRALGAHRGARGGAARRVAAARQAALAGAAGRGRGRARRHARAARAAGAAAAARAPRRQALALSSPRLEWCVYSLKPVGRSAPSRPIGSDTRWSLAGPGPDGGSRVSITFPNFFRRCNRTTKQMYRSSFSCR